MRDLEKSLRQGVDVLGLSLDDLQIDHLLDYLTLIQKWTKVYNLTSVRAPADMLTHHLLDSLAVIAPLRRQFAALGSNAVQSSPVHKLLDVGSGAGLPGVVISICCPEVLVDCVDTVAKKVAFIRQVAATLKLSNLRGLHARVESLTDKYPVISSRAFASLADFTSWSSTALAEEGVWMAMKGKMPDEEITVLPKEVTVFQVEQLQVPGLDAERCLLWLRRSRAVN
jgi:16S rRNA (guanine527-N7)-methyltransferase